MRAVLNDGIVVERVGQEYVVMNIHTADIYTLNETASRIWPLLLDSSQLCLEQLASMGFSNENATRFLNSFLESLVSAGLVECIDT